jgi:hypothetical protein
MYSQNPHDPSLNKEPVMRQTSPPFSRRSLLSLMILIAGVGHAGGLQDSFQSPVFRTTVGSDPLSVASGDFNGDGLKDLAVANYLSNDLSILLATGNGSFGAQTRVAVGTLPYSIAVGDFNADGAQDLAVANSGSNYLSILSGIGDGTFAPETRLDGFGSKFVAIGDFNGDGRRDLAVTGLDEVAILQGVGDATFILAGRYGTGRDPRSIAVGDFNTDGIEDLAVADYFPPDSPPGAPGEVSILLGLGGGLFGPETRFAAGHNPFSVAVGEFNGDGRQDLAVANDTGCCGDISVLLGVGNGQFAPKIAIPAGFQPNHVAVGDLDRDGRQDLVVANRGTDSALVLTGLGDGHFAPKTRIGSGDGAFSVTLADFTGDGLTDVAVVGSRADDLRVVPGLGDGHFGPATSGTTGEGPEAVAVGDLNGDGLPDLAAANFHSDDVSVLLSLGGGTLAPQARYSVGHEPGAVAIADLNADGRLDLVTANRRSGDLSVLLGLGGGAFGPQTLLPSVSVDNKPRSVAIADFNGDGRLDLAVANDGSIYIGRGFVSVFLGSGDGTFSPQMTFAAGVNPRFVTTGDFNGDSRTDLAVADPGPGAPFPSPDILVLPGFGDGTFGSPLSTGGGNPPRSMAVGDFNGDGRQDLAVARGDLSVLLGNGDGTFGPETHYQSILGAASVAIDDIDRDGRQDLAVTDNSANVISLLPGLGDGTFGPQINLPVGADPFSIAAGDFNGDGAVDLASVHASADDVWILLNRHVPVRIVDVSISFSSLLGKGSGTLRWTTEHETDLSGFNIVVLDHAGQRVQLNFVLIPCEECVTGVGHTYTYIIPKHKSGRNIFVEAVHEDGRIKTFGPAQRN